ncbi:hypothetical protein J3454_15590 [Erythrobacter sp. NFXS35]|uniref:LuxR C-terminal-related transcriptional regulator n=1 Tax=Erythrobacter sp. NFXS35 TaxID=2818436 RepID=UPI0032E05010
MFDSLTDKQHQTLRLAARHLTSKQIASELKLAPVTIDKRIEGVRARLGSIPRTDLLRLYGSWCETYDRTINDPAILGEQHKEAAFPSQQLFEEPLAFNDSIVFDARASWDRPSEWLRPGVNPSDLGIAGKLLVMLAGAVAIMMVAVLSMAFAEGLMSMVMR